MGIAFYFGMDPHFFFHAITALLLLAAMFFVIMRSFKRSDRWLHETRGERSASRSPTRRDRNDVSQHTNGSR